ncbi:MAG: DNA-3-methyladenine glycosylase I [Alkaliphilus sp.]|nr:DNA-3-methyladenine glycosylase I [bacterium AH-315-G05]MBN4074713.1 DNA-3-methyladenine glycosylase I [bacterium AH-315-E09]PHS36409.1 MAG: DNA-3-methyladenine glycosylase I [Alkaliphilus sp.]
MKNRCGWVGKEAIYIKYHDEEWGVPVHDDKQLFEKLILDGAQAGLSWITILKKQQNYREAFDGFDAEIIVNYNDVKIEELMQNSGIVRNRRKIESVVKNARAFLEVQKEFGSFDKYLWQFVNYKTIKSRWENIKDVPSKTKESEKMSKDMKKRGFSFVGATICYAFMQAIGMVNDHVVTCFRHEEV